MAYGDKLITIVTQLKRSFDSVGSFDGESYNISVMLIEIFLCTSYQLLYKFEIKPLDIQAMSIIQKQMITISIIRQGSRKM